MEREEEMSSDNLRSGCFKREIDGTPQRIHWVEIPPTGTAQIKIVKTTTLKEAVERYNPLAAINGGFVFFTSDLIFLPSYILRGAREIPELYSPIGALISDGRVFGVPSGRRPGIIITSDGEIKIVEALTPEILQIKVDNERFSPSIIDPLSGQNLDKEVVCFTPYYGVYVPSFLRDRNNIAIINCPERLRAKSLKWPYPIPVNGLVLSFPRETMRSILPENIEVMPHESIIHALEAGPLLVSEGKECPLDEESLRKQGFVYPIPPTDLGGRRGHWSRLAPRSAFGIKEDGTIVLVVAEGRSEEAYGLSLPQFSHFILKELGCFYAINLDGGGASQIWRNGDFTNTPIAKNGRPLIDGRIIVSAIVALSN